MDFIWEQDFSRNSLQILINMLLKALSIIYKDVSRGDDTSHSTLHPISQRW